MAVVRVHGPCSVFAPNIAMRRGHTRPWRTRASAGATIASAALRATDEVTTVSASASSMVAGAAVAALAVQRICSHAGSTQSTPTRKIVLRRARQRRAAMELT